MSFPHPQACAKSPASQDYFSSWETKEVLAALLIPHRCGIVPACSLVHAHIHFLSHCFLNPLRPYWSQNFPKRLSVCPGLYSKKQDSSHCVVGSLKTYQGGFTHFPQSLDKALKWNPPHSSFLSSLPRDPPCSTYHRSSLLPV